MATAVTVSATNNADIDGLLSGYKWTGTISYSFPDSASDYSSPYSGGNSEPTSTGFAPAPSQMQAAINYAIGLIQSYTNATIQYAGTDGADIMVAQSSKPNPTSYAYYPGNYAAGGDVWFGTHYDYTQAKLGNYEFTTALHELGHAFGLKHSNETTGGVANVAVPSAHDDSEYTVMSYRSYVGASATAGYSNEAYGYPQTYMANDILALQTMYGANYTTQSGTTVYSWSPTTGQEFINGVGQPADNGGAGGSANRIYETIWDGGGVDTYDLSNYTTNLSINLNPGASSVFSAVQLANLGDNQNLGYDHYASGNVYNAYLYNGDARSYIDNATGGSGNDIIIGNPIANVLNGGAGNDTITGGGGNDTIIGGPGTDTAVYSSNRANYHITYNSSTQTFTFVDLGSGSPDGTDTITGVENFQFANGTLSATTLINQVGDRTVEAIGATSLVQFNGYYYLNPSAGGTGPTLKDTVGSAISVGQLSALTALGAEQVGSGYYVAWKSVTYDQYVVWNVDSSGTQSAFDVASYVSGTSYALESLETTFHQDLNGDGTIGVVTTVIETSGTTSLTQIANNYFFNPVAGGTGPELLYNGFAVLPGQFAGATPIGAEHTATGYEVAWHIDGTSNYGVWYTDSSGNYLSNIGVVSGTSNTLESLESSFHQDLNGDGFIGVPATVIESAGSTILALVGGNYFMNPVAGGTGPELMFNGSAVVPGQFSGVTAIGAEHTATGYEVAWHIDGTSNYGLWYTDSSGNYLSNIGVVSGTSSTLESLESSFHQDLNGDGFIGVPATVIESAGSTILALVGGNYFMNPVAGGTGPELMFNGSAVVPGQFSGVTAIGAEQTATGYEVAWHVDGTTNYGVWFTDSSGNYLSNIGVVSGTSSALESLEPSFHQDLNGDGVIGAAAAGGTVIESAGSTSLTQIGSNYYLYNGGTGPELKFQGTPVVAGQFPGITPIGGEQTSTGYEVAWKVAATDQYGVWYTDTNGNYLSNIGLVSATSSTLESLETSFHQDLNGDGTIGVPAASPMAPSDSAWLHEFFAAPGGTPDLQPAAQTGNVQSQPELSVTPDAHDVGAYLTQFLLAQSHTDLFGH